MPTRPYPNRGRARRAVHRRREAYLRTATARYTHYLQRYVLGPLETELGVDLAPFQGMTAELLRPHREREAYLQARVQARARQLEPAFRRLYLISQIASLDT